MPIDPVTKFRVPSGLPGDWTTEYKAFFWHDNEPLAVKFAIEKMTANLLKHHPEHPDYPVYLCPKAGVMGEIAITLRLEAIIAGKRLYSLHLAFKSPRNWVDEDEFFVNSKRTFDYWCGQLKVAGDEIPWDQASAELLEQEVKRTLEAEAAAERAVVDSAPIREVQQQVLEAIRKGGRFYLGHKEGTINIYFNGKDFVRRDEGEDPQFIRYESEEEFLKAMRNFHDWDARKDTYPHSPPEVEVWKFILSKVC